MKTQRIKLEIDLDTCELLGEEIENFIKGAVKSKTREWFQEEFSEEIQRLINDRIDKWVKKGSYSFDRNFYIVLNEKVDAAVNKCLDTYVVTPDMIKERVEERLGYINSTIARVVTEKVDALKINEHVGQYVRKRVEEALTQEILKAVLGRLDGLTLADLKSKE